MTHISSTGFWSGESPFHAMSKPLANWIVEYLGNHKDKQIYDFGCGTGMYLKTLQNAGFTKLTGFEGDVPTNKEFSNIIKQDLTKPFTVAEPGTVISLEVAEHIPKQYTQAYLNNLFNACESQGKLIISWAVRGQGGHGHCHELNNDEAIALVVAKGFTYLGPDTKSARLTVDPTKNSVENGDLPWFHNTVLIFQKNS